MLTGDGGMRDNMPAWSDPTMTRWCVVTFHCGLIIVPVGYEVNVGQDGYANELLATDIFEI